YGGDEELVEKLYVNATFGTDPIHSKSQTGYVFILNGVTVTNHAVITLRMLRENKDIFDLIISDVHMLGMDGFKLLGIDSKNLPVSLLLMLAEC
ncbi:hypothetical protein ZWY2020_004657, partial [Hordeum vulgare]